MLENDIEEKKIYEDTVARRIANFKRLANAALESKDFDKCRAWCDKYIQQDAIDGSIWWVKLLAINQSCNSNELFDQCLENAVSIAEHVQVLLKEIFRDGVKAVICE